MTSTYDIFISYRRDENKWLAYALQSELESYGYSVFLDTQDGSIGEDFPEELDLCIKKCKDFILVLNQHTLDRCMEPSDWVYREVSIAVANNKHIIPLTTEPYNWSINMPNGLESINKKNEFKYYPIEHARVLTTKLVNGLFSKPVRKYMKNIYQVLSYIITIIAVGTLSSLLTMRYDEHAFMNDYLETKNQIEVREQMMTIDRNFKLQENNTIKEYKPQTINENF